MFEAQLQHLPLVGAVVSGVMAIFFYFLNGYQEKQEGKREAELEHVRESQKQDQQIRERSHDVEETARSVRAHTDNDHGLFDETEPGPDYHFRD